MRLYRRADRDKDGELDAREFARVFDVEASNPFLPRLVRLFDVSGDGKLSPFEFIVCLSQFTSSSRTNREAHVAFAWRLFDTNDDGSLEIVDTNLDECTLCELCLAVGQPGQVRVLKLYEDGKPLERSA